MQNLLRLVQLVVLTGTLLSGNSPMLAQDSRLIRHFDYDKQAPLTLKEIGVERRGDVRVYDIAYASPKDSSLSRYPQLQSRVFLSYSNHQSQRSRGFPSISEPVSEATGLATSAGDETRVRNATQIQNRER